MALKLHRQQLLLLPDMERLLGSQHPRTLTTRDNVAFWTGVCGDAAQALRLFEELLPDRERVLGPRPPRKPDHSEQHRVLGRPFGDVARPP